MVFDELRSLHTATTMALDLSNSEMKYFENICSSLHKQITSLEQQLRDTKSNVLTLENKIHAADKDQLSFQSSSLFSQRRFSLVKMKSTSMIEGTSHEHEDKHDDLVSTNRQETQRQRYSSSFRSFFEKDNERYRRQAAKLRRANDLKKMLMEREKEIESLERAVVNAITMMQHRMKIREETQYILCQ